MKIVLLQPPYTIAKNKYKQAVPPLGLAYIAAVLEKHHHSVQIIDSVIEGIDREEMVDSDFKTYGLSLPDIYSKVAEFEPDIIGISCPFSSQRINAYKLAEYLKERMKHIPIIMGGEHPSACPEDSLEFQAIDYVVIGEGEYTMLQLVNYFSNNEDVNIEEIDGLAYINDLGRIVIQPKKQFIGNLDELPIPARHLLPMEKYFDVNMPQGLITKHKENTAITASRGCPCRCVFCSTSNFWGNRVRLRGPQQVVDEIRFLKDTYGIKEIQFLDDNLTANYENAKTLFELIIREKLDIKWTTPQGIAIWTLDYPLLKLMKESGCYAITLGVESGSQRVLSKVIGKPIKLEIVSKVVNEARSLGLYVFAFFVIGLPGETYEELRETFKVARGLKLDIPVFSFALPLPGTRLYDICKEEKYISDTYTYDYGSYHKPQLLTKEYSQKQIVSLLKHNQRMFLLKMMITSPLRLLIIYWCLLKKVASQKAKRFIRHRQTDTIRWWWKHKKESPYKYQLLAKHNRQKYGTPIVDIKPKSKANKKAKAR